MFLACCRIVVILVLLSVSSFFSFSQNIFMEVKDSPIKGESVNSKRKDMIEIANISQGNERCVGLGGGGGGREPCNITIGQLQFNMPLNTSAIGFRNQMFLGEIMDKVDVYFEEWKQAKQVTYQKILMEDVYVVGVEEVAESDGRPTVQVILQATKIGWLYYKIDPITDKPVDKPLKTGWDVASGKVWIPAD